MKLLSLSIGAFFGTITRYLVGQLVPLQMNGFPLGTLLMNLAGCFFLGWLFTRWAAPSATRIGIGTGFTGSFTTFSTFSVESMNLIANQHMITALLYILASMVGGMLLAAVGCSLAKLQTRAIRREQK